MVSKLPTHRRIFKTDLGADAPPWVENLLRPLNSFIQATIGLLNGQLRFEANIEAKKLSLLVNGTNSTLSFPNPFTRPLEGLLLLKVTGLTSGNAVSVANWEEVDGEIIVVIEGLTAGLDYTLRFLAV